MTLFEAIYFLVILLCGGIGAAAFGRQWGWLFGIPGFILGLVAGFLFFKLLGLLSRAWGVWKPLRPPCERGRCRSGDYEFVRVEERGAVFKCRCGDEYLNPDWLPLTTRRFMRLLPDGSVRPYMKARPLCRWRKEGENNSPPSPTP